MREEEALALVDEQGIVRHDGEVEQHLVDLAVAISAHGDDVLSVGIEQARYFGGVVTWGNGVAGPEVEEVAKEAEHVGSAALKIAEKALERRLRAVDVGGDKVFHCFINGER